MRKWPGLAALLLVIASASPALAQRTTATVRGTVTDATQAVLPGVTVTAVNQENGLTRTVVTNSSGVYSLPDLPVGRYNVSAELQGFKKAERTAVPLRVADEYSIDFTLQPGNVSETVTVEATSTPVKVMGGDVSGVVTGQQVRELPLNGRNFLQLATLMPGVSAPDALNVKDKGLLGGSDLSVSGSDVTANMWTVDGANNNDVGSNRTILVYPSLEAIEEFKIMRNSYGPEFGGAGGAQINIVTRGGTNEFRGSAFYSGRSDKFNATNYFLKEAKQPKEPLKRNDFGGSIGGPLVKDKLHFFASFEYNLEDRGTARSALVPTDGERNGNFNDRVPGCSPGIPTDPLTGLPFPGNQIPANRLSPAGKAFLNLYPSPNVTPAAGSCNNWVTSVTTPIDYHQFHGRMDWNLGARSRVMVRYTQDSWKNKAPSLYSNLWGDDPFPAVDSNWDQPSRSFVTSLNQTIGNSATNTLQFSYSANKIKVTRGGFNPDLNAQILSLMPSIYPLSAKEYGDQTGHPVFWGGAGYQPLWNEAPFLNNQDLYVVKDDYTKVFGKHFIKAGALYSTNKKNEDTNGNGSAQNSAFWGSAGLNGWGANTGNILADFLLRDMTFGFSEPSASRQAPQRWQDAEFYVADSWQVTRRVTFDYGVRYSLFYNPYTTDNKIASFQPDLYNPALGSDACNGSVLPPGTNFCSDAGAKGGTAGPNRSLMKQDLNNIAPRLGVAWDLKGDGKTAIRAGLGQFFLRERLSPGLSIAGNPPFTQTTSGIRKLDTNVEPCDGCFGRSLGSPAVGRELQMKTPNNWQWNVMFQHEVWRNATLETGYVGNYGYDLLRNMDINQVPAANRQAYATLPGGSNGATLRPYGSMRGDSTLTFWDHGGKSKYHSWQTQFVNRFGEGSQVQASYTLSSTKSNISLDDSSGGLSAAVAPLDLSQPDFDWGRAAVARTHIFNASLVWMLPRLENKTGLVRHLFGDWETTAIFGMATGQPVTVFVGSIPGLIGGPSGTGYTGNQRPNRTSASCAPSSGARKEQIINPDAFTVNGFVLGTIGTEKRGECDGPGYSQTDLAFYKNFNLSGRVRAQFRWDIFNIFNNTNFIYGSLNGTLNPSSVTLNAAGNTIVNSVVPNNFLQATRTRDPRQMQFGFKLLW